MNSSELRLRASHWIDAWNNRDLDKVLEHYSDDVELCSPFVVERWKISEGRIIGKQKLREHFAKAFTADHGSRMKLMEVLESVNSILFLYHNKTGRVSADVVELDSEGKIKTVKAYYSSKE